MTRGSSSLGGGVAARSGHGGRRPPCADVDAGARQVSDKNAGPLGDEAKAVCAVEGRPHAVYKATNRARARHGAGPRPTDGEQPDSAGEAQILAAGSVRQIRRPRQMQAPRNEWSSPANRPRVFRFTSAGSAGARGRAITAAYDGSSWRRALPYSTRNTRKRGNTRRSPTVIFSVFRSLFRGIPVFVSFVAVDGQRSARPGVKE